MLKLNALLLAIFLFCNCQFDKKVKYKNLQTFDNKLTKAGIELGKKLFYDSILSKSNQISCASCHRQSDAFADKGLKSSVGETGNDLHRNTPALFNLSEAKGYFWDGGARNLESQVFGPIKHPDEMAQDLKLLCKELKQIPTYPILFKNAFGDTVINSQRIAFALAQFERSLISNQSKYDKVLLGKAYFTTNELKGKKVFENNCSKCHGGNNFTTFGYENNHLDSIFNDYRFERLFLGRFRITGDSSDIGKYKIPSLRNLEFTAPFMHDGRFTTLNEVMEHYSKRFQLSISEKQSLIAFLHTLSDSAFISNSAFAKPK